MLGFQESDLSDSINSKSLEDTQLFWFPSACMQFLLEICCSFIIYSELQQNNSRLNLCYQMPYHCQEMPCVFAILSDQEWFIQISVMAKILVVLLLVVIICYFFLATGVMGNTMGKWLEVEGHLFYFKQYIVLEQPVHLYLSFNAMVH